MTGLDNKGSTRRERVRGEVVAVREVRFHIVRAGDLRNEIGFQNDINVLLAALNDSARAWASVGPLLSAEQFGPRYDDGPPTLADSEAASPEFPIQPMFRRSGDTSSKLPSHR